MKNAIFLVTMACLLAGCADDSRPDFKIVVQGSEKQTPPLKITTEPNLPVKSDIQSDKGLPVKNKALQVSFKPSKANRVAALEPLCLRCYLPSVLAWPLITPKKLRKDKLFVELTQEYVSNEIGKGIKDLDDWWKREGGAMKAIEEWQNRNNVKLTEQELKKNAEEILKRFGDKYQIVSKVAIYFSTTLQLYKSKYVSRKFARSICEITRITEDTEYLMELSVRANGGGNKKVEEFRNGLRKIRRIESA
jgi:hypothetical protein